MTALAFLAIATAGARAADDKVVLQPAGSSSRISLPCTILDYTGTAITVRTPLGGEPKTYPASQVVEVLTLQTESHQAGLDHLANNRAAEARESLETALKEESRAWVRREILAQLVRCSLLVEDFATAASRFLLLVKSDPDTRHFRLVPLVWAPVQLPASTLTEARAWITDSSDVARLIGASLLLDDDNYGDLAAHTLKELTASRVSRVQHLARAQLWRTELRTANVDDFRLSRWDGQIAAIPEDLRGGPFFLLGRGHLLRQNDERAAAALLWVPLVYDHDHQLSARACLAAGDALLRLGQKDEARTLYREVVVRFGHTSFANDAAAQLQSMHNNKLPN